MHKKHKIKVKIQLPQRGKKLEIIKSTLKNAEENLNRKIYENLQIKKILKICNKHLTLKILLKN